MRLSPVCAGVLPWLGLLLAASCSSGSGSPPGGTSSEPLALSSVRHGQLVDVYGVASTAEGEALALHGRDVLVGHELPAGGPDSPYDLLGSHPESLQPRVLIRHAPGTPAFAAALAALRSGTRALDLSAPAAARAVPRDAALELRFTRPLGLEDGELEPGRGVQLWQDDERLPVRVLARGDRLIVDPLLLGREAEALGVAGRTPGLPAADRDASPLRLVLALEGPLALSNLAAAGAPVAADPSGRASVQVAFATAPAAGASRAVQGAPRLVGELPFFLERVDEVGEGIQEATLFKNGVSHDIDRGDGLRLFVAGSVIPVVVTEVTRDPADDNGQPAVQHVRTRVFRSNALEQIDPSNLPGYPSNPQTPAGEAWLVANAPRAVLVTEFDAERVSAGGQPLPGDDLANFVTFTPAPLPGTGPSAPNQNVSPHAAAILRFSAPIDLTTARPFDTLILATRDLLDPAGQLQFALTHNIDPALFVAAKYFTPHLVHSRVFDVSGHQTTLRLQPPLGFYLDEAMRQADEGQPFEAKQFRYYLHVVAGPNGLKGLNGMELDLGFVRTPGTHVVLPFSLDTRKQSSGAPLFPDNLVATVARRFENRDEDEQPSYYQPSEVQPPGQPFNTKSFPLEDLAGAVVYLLDGKLSARPLSRVRQVVDDLNQIPPPPQSSELRFCPEFLASEEQVPFRTTEFRFENALQDPLNPYGARLQTVWREIDMSLSRHDPFDFNLDVEGMYWAPFTGGPIVFDRFERVSLFLGHSENRPEPCVGEFSALPSLPESGLVTKFTDNYVSDVDLSGNPVPGPAPHPAFVDTPLVIDPANAVTEPNGVYRYLPLPEFQRPHFVWRDERVMAQGASSRTGNDAADAGFDPYIRSPFLTGRGRLVTGSSSEPQFNLGAWDNRDNFLLSQPAQPDPYTGGLVGSVGLPLIMDFQTHPSLGSAGVNGWQISLALLSSWSPSFRAYSSGGQVGGMAQILDPSSPGWQTALGGVTGSGTRTRPADNSVFWLMADFLKRTSVATAGFVEITDPHRMPTPAVDPRLGPYPTAASANTVFVWDVTPAGESFPPGTQVAVEFRGAGPVDPQPWAAVVNRYNLAAGQEPPDPVNFPLDPLKAGDAHIRKFDDRTTGGPPRNTWTRYYNEIVTDYTPDANTLMDPAFTSRFAGPNETFLPEDVTYFNWRLLMTNALDGVRPTPTLDSFAISYRLESSR